MLIEPFSAMVRTFISIDFNNEELVSNVIRIQQQLGELEAKLKFVNPKILHGTLEFIGEISSAQIDQISNMLDEIKFSKFNLAVEQPGLLPNEKYIRVIYCSIVGDIDSLKETQKDIRSRLRNLGYKIDNRPFKPHLTIARVKSIQNKSELIKVISNLSDFICGEQEIDSIKLKKSILSPQGPEYSTLHEVKAQ